MATNEPSSPDRLQQVEELLFLLSQQTVANQAQIAANSEGLTELGLLVSQIGQRVDANSQAIDRLAEKVDRITDQLAQTNATVDRVAAQINQTSGMVDRVAVQVEANTAFNNTLRQLAQTLAQSGQSTL